IIWQMRGIHAVTNIIEKTDIGMRLPNFRVHPLSQAFSALIRHSCGFMAGIQQAIPALRAAGNAQIFYAHRFCFHQMLLSMLKGKEKRRSSIA
ncbi:MAG: hypothetical protein IJJ60_14245, partial [Clostridia bacterium]|nr:hypothetical protein [Clostridia bacterium]